MPLIIVDHPLVRHKLGILRNVETPTNKFRDLTREITALLTYEACRDLPLEPRTEQGWAGPVQVERLSGKKMAVVPILRAGLGMMNGVLDMIPSARVGIVGLFRNEETLQPVEYYKKFSTDIADRSALVVDPMLATGNSLAAACDLLLKAGCASISCICMVAAPEGVEVMERRHPEIHVFAAALDDRLNEVGYILPGLGDAGDRLFGTR